MGDAEKSDAFDFLVENGILYSKLRNETNDTFLAASSYGNDVDAVSNPNYNNRRMYWTRSHDGCIENLRTGDIILVTRCNFIAMSISIFSLGQVIALDGDGESLYLEDPDPNDKWQKWKVNKNTGVILNRATRTPLSSYSNDVPYVASNYTGHDCFEFTDAKYSYSKFLSDLTL